MDISNGKSEECLNYYLDMSLVLRQRITRLSCEICMALCDIIDIDNIIHKFNNMPFSFLVRSGADYNVCEQNQNSFCIYSPISKVYLCFIVSLVYLGCVMFLYTT